MTNLQNAVIGEIPNLDCFVLPSEAAAMQAEFRGLAVVCTQLASYCEAKQSAMVLRDAGYVEAAQRFEHAAESIFLRLPDWARW